LPHFAHISACLITLLRKGTKFVWDEDSKTAFLDLKSRRATRSILTPPNFSPPFSLAMDASDIATGVSLFQTIDDTAHPVAYYSKKFNVYERNYSTVEKEALALILATRTFLLSIAILTESLSSQIIVHYNFTQNG